MLAYVQFPSLVPVLQTILTATVFTIFASFKCGRDMLEKVLNLFHSY